MQGILRCMSFVACVAFSDVSIQAACGGGGYKPSKQTVRREEVRQEYTRPVASSGSQSTPGFDTSRFEALRARLDLNHDQYLEIYKAKQEIGERLEQARRDVARAQTGLDRCHGNCESEKRALAEAQAKLRGIDAKREFDGRLEAVLNESQKQTYRSSGT